MDDYVKRLIQKNKKGRADIKQRRSIPEKIGAANRVLYNREWEDSEKNEALIRAYNKRLNEGHMSRLKHLAIDIEPYSGDKAVEKESASITLHPMPQRDGYEKRDRTDWVRSKKKKKKGKQKHDNKKTDRCRKHVDSGYGFQGHMANRSVSCRSSKRELDIDSVVKTLKEQHSFLCVTGQKLYAFTGKYYEDITDKNNATAIFKEFLSEDTNRLIRDYTEIYNQLLSDRDIWYSSINEIRKNRNVIVFENGTYNVLEEEFYENKFWEDDRVFFMHHFEYHPEDITGKEFVEDFIGTFCNDDWKRIKLFKQIVGYCLSNYENKKAFFYFLGVPNSGKSSVCRFLETAVGSDAYISVAVKQLNSRFVSGELEGAKICADEDVAIKTALKSEDVSMIKKITSSDKIRTDAKYLKPGQLHPECKLVLAGNGMLTFETSEDLQPLMERMIIFPLDRAIPEDQRDPNIVDKLIAGRNYIISEALKALHDLVKNNFRFTKVVQTEKYFSTKIFSSGIEDFVEECCQLEECCRESTAVLHTAYMQFCTNHPEYKPEPINQFSSYLKKKYGLQSFNDGRNRGKIGIRLL